MNQLPLMQIAVCVLLVGQLNCHLSRPETNQRSWCQVLVCYVLFLLFLKPGPFCNFRMKASYLRFFEGFVSDVVSDIPAICKVSNPKFGHWTRSGARPMSSWSCFQMSGLCPIYSLNGPGGSTLCLEPSCLF